MSTSQQTSGGDRADALRCRYRTCAGEERAVVAALDRQGIFAVYDVPAAPGADGTALLVERLDDDATLEEALALAREYGFAKAAYHGALRDGEPCADPLRGAPSVPLADVRADVARARATARGPHSGTPARTPASGAMPERHACRAARR